MHPDGNMPPRHVRRGTGLRDGLRQQRVPLQRVRARGFARVHVRLPGEARRIDDKFRPRRLKIFQQHVKRL